jgi:4'-phosphopantetheinyl transferase
MSDTVRIWLADVGALDDDRLAHFASLLGADESARLCRFARPQRRRQFIAGRILLRHAASVLLQVASAQLRVVERPGQAPLLFYGATEAPVHFSLSHSGRWIACAASATLAVGLDVERLDAARDLVALAGQAFGDEVARRLAALPLAQRLPSFYRRWSEHEALYKLGAAAGSAPACVALPHPELAIVLCSAAALAMPPRLTVVTLAPPFGL